MRAAGRRAPRPPDPRGRPSAPPPRAPQLTAGGAQAGGLRAEAAHPGGARRLAALRGASGEVELAQVPLVCQRTAAGAGAVLLTNNRGISEWSAIFADPLVAAAILDRVLHHRTIVAIRGESYRLREKRRSGLLRGATEASKPEAGRGQRRPRLRRRHEAKPSKPGGAEFVSRRDQVLVSFDRPETKRRAHYTGRDESAGSKIRRASP